MKDSNDEDDDDDKNKSNDNSRNVTCNSNKKGVREGSWIRGGKRW
jgi:hypothetical protein